jgi:hypothetical protein
LFSFHSKGQCFFAHIRNWKCDTGYIFVSYLINFMSSVCSGYQTVTRSNVPYISLPWASWTHIPNIHPGRSSCISQFSCLLHLCVCCQVCHFIMFSRYSMNSLSLFWLNCEVECWMFLSTLNIEKPFLRNVIYKACLFVLPDFSPYTYRGLKSSSIFCVNENNLCCVKT